MEETSKNSEDKKLIRNYVIYGILFTGAIFIFSVFMASISSIRNSISISNYESVSQIYGGDLNQYAPTLNSISEDSEAYTKYGLDAVRTKKYLENTNLAKTDGKVVIVADFVKKGLAYQPTFKTDFTATYFLENKLDEKSVISFEFPFPVSSETNEISHAKLLVNGQEYENAKAKIEYSYDDYNSYEQEVEGLKWEGEVEAGSETEIQISYQTVSLSLFTYEGMENPSGSQDFNFSVEINGTKSYDVASGLSVDRREFAAEKVKLIWEKEDLYSKPTVNVQVGEKTNPSVKVSRVYLTMTPIYMVFITILMYLAFKFGKKVKIFDMFLITILYTVYFPFIHYLSSFTIDPTLEIFARMDKSIYYSMPLYLAFAIAWTVISGLIYYLMGKVSDFKFATKMVCPTLVLFLGFFPLVVTVPEYSMLMVIIGAIALITIILQVRIKLARREK